MGLDAVKALLDREEFSATPGILETPKDGPESDRLNLEFALRLTKP